MEIRKQEIPFLEFCKIQLLELTNTCSLQDRKSFNQYGKYSADKKIYLQLTTSTGSFRKNVKMTMALVAKIPKAVSYREGQNKEYEQV